MSTRLTLPNRRNHITQKVRIDGPDTLYLSVHYDMHPAEILLRVKGQDCTAELVGLYDLTARLMSLTLQYGPGIRGSALPSLGPSLLHAAGTLETQC